MGGLIDVARSARWIRIAMALAATACAEPPPEEMRPPDVLLVTIDTLRADHTSLYGYERPTTPVLDALAAEGVWFSNAYSPTSTTAPSIASLMTSLYPHAHGVTANGRMLPARFSTLAERMRGRGYETAAFVSSIVVSQRVGFNRGFDHFDDRFERADSSVQLKEWQGVALDRGGTDRRADATATRCIRWLSSRPRDAGPIFVWVHFMDPHEPYSPPSAFGDPFDASRAQPASLERAIASYDTEIAFTDQQLGRVIDAFDAFASPIGGLVVVTADHGEAFLDHGWRGHAAQIYEESVRVPLVFRQRGVIESGREVETLASLVDVTPTLLGLLDSNSDPPAAGADLSPELLGDPLNSPEAAVYFERQLYDRDGHLAALPLYEMGGARFGPGLDIAGSKRGIRSGRWKYLEAPAERPPRELYDLESDPRERLNLISAEPAIAARLATLLTTQATNPAPLAPPLTTDRPALEALGYLPPNPPGS